MAFNRKTFQTRALTAAVFVVVMLGGLLWNHWSFFILFSIIHFGCWIEFQKLVGLIDPGYKEITPFHQYGVMVAGWCVMLWFTGDAYHIFELRLHELGWWAGLIFAFVLPIIELLFAKTIQLKNIGHSLFGLIYISLSWGLLMDLRNIGMSTKGEILALDYGMVIPCIIFFSIWLNDTMAYVLGSLIGKTPLSKISPNKTWEGTIGGAIICIAIIALMGWWTGLCSIKDSIAISSISAIAGNLGDLLQSKLKRMAGVKDSGTLMPGHGGFLDRFDSMLLAIPFVWLYVIIFMK